jgi:chemotaxis protein methyltransferase CheR
MAFVRDLVYRRSAIVLDQSKDYLITSRLEQAARESGLRNAGELLTKVRAGQATLDTQVVEAMTTHETTFFRDVQPFEALRLDIMPKLIAARQHTRTIAIWCAACSSGQEPYSVAMTLLDSFPQLNTWNVRILGTDISGKVLDTARQGQFRQMDCNRGLPARMLLKYFNKRGLNWEVNDDLKRIVSFQKLNLLENWNLMFTPDIIFMRNVLIYFDIATKRALLQRARSLLAGDGVLFLGAAETTMGLDDNWDRVAFQQTAYYRPKR